MYEERDGQGGILYNSNRFDFPTESSTVMIPLYLLYLFKFRSSLLLMCPDWCSCVLSGGVAMEEKVQGLH